MPSYREIVYGIYGAWRLARLDSGAMTYFERTVASFWKSFFAAVIVAPGYAIFIAYELAQSEFDAGVLRLIVVESLAYLLGWIAFPVVAHQICEVIGKREAYIGCIVALNWSGVIQIAVFLPVIVLIVGGVISEDFGSLLLLLLTFVVLGYEWFIIRTALAVTAAGAVGFVVLDVVIELIIEMITFGMLR